MRITRPIPEGVERIYDYTYASCDNLRTLEIPNTVTDTREYAFSGSGIVSIKIPSSVTYLSKDCFFICKNLSRIIFEDTENPLGFEYNDISFKASPIKDIYIGREIRCSVIYPDLKKVYFPFQENHDIEIITIGVNAPNIDVLYGNDSNNSKFPDLKVINCCSEIPIDVPMFTNEQYATVQVNVPYGALDTYKEENKNDFIDWRYYYEKPTAASSDFLAAFSNAIITVGESL